MYYDTERFTLYHGDNREVLKQLPDNSIDSIVTDPPYELGFMGKKWDSTGIAYDVELWREVLRVLKPGGHLLAFSGSRTYHRMAVAIEDAGFDIRDQIMWIYGSGFPKSHNLKGEWQGWGTALKPAHEPIVMARKPVTATVAANVLEWGVGGLNIDDTRVASDDGFEKAWDKPVTTNISAKGGKYISKGNNHIVDLSGYKPLGRWPANVIHDGSDEVVELFPNTKGGVAVRHNSGGKNFGSDAEKPAMDDLGYGDSGSAARFFYCAKAGKRDRNEGLDGFEIKQTTGGGGLTEVGGAYGSIKAPAQNHHPTVKPTDLMAYLCRLVTPNSGTVLDPFMGSGSTGKAAMYEGFKFVGIEMTDEYLPIAKARIEFALNEESEKLL
jgi:DNA modification methylase